MIEHLVRVHRSDENLAREDQLAWSLALIATDPVAVSDEVSDMIVNRVIDNAAVAAASLLRPPVTAARAQARRHPMSPGATIFAMSPERRVSPEWAAWANAVAVRELDYHDTFLAAEYSHPGDNIAPLVAVAQHVGAARSVDGADLVRAIATAYEVQIDLARAISLHEHKIDHVAHLGPSVAAGLGTLLGLDEAIIFQAIGQSLHTTTATRQSRKGEISSWKAFAPAFAAKAAIEALDRAMRGETSPTPIYEGEDGVIAWMLGGPRASYTVALPAPGEAKRAILDSYTKEHSAEYQAQAWIDLAIRLHREHPELIDGTLVDKIVIHSSYHTHVVIGSGANDPQKYDPDASRETLDHSLPYIFTVALQDGVWHHGASYAAQRARRSDTIDLWRRVSTVEDPEWSRRYLATDPREKAFGGWVEIVLRDTTTLRNTIVVPDAHPLGARPFARADYLAKFRSLAGASLEDAEIERFLDAAQSLASLRSDQLDQLTFRARAGLLDSVVEPEGLI